LGNNNYDPQVIKEISNRFDKLEILRPQRVVHYEPGERLNYEMTSLEDNSKSTVTLEILKFVGGGFAGQVYQVKVTEIAGPKLSGIECGQIYAIKILIPPSNFALAFRNALYAFGFQSPFQLQVNPKAARSGALWQKFIRAAAKEKFGNEHHVVDIHATFVDSKLGSCGEISEWLEGRTWRLEVDERVDLLRKWECGCSKNLDESKLGSPEYRAKKDFMVGFVALLHEIGAHEFARQYEWTTWKSQPNCLKRKAFEGSPSEGLTAVDFRAGLTLLPFLPMSPGDFLLIVKGLLRGSLVQFDRGDLNTLRDYIANRPEAFKGVAHRLQELSECEGYYRSSQLDLTHNLFRIFSPSFWRTILISQRESWLIRGWIDSRCFEGLGNFGTVILSLFGIIPLLGKFTIKLFGNENWRSHLLRCFQPSYLFRALKGVGCERAINWLRAGRISEERALTFSQQSWRSLFHLPLAIFPAGLHRFFTDWKRFKETLHYYAVRPIRLYFDANLREEWLFQMIEEGEKKHLLTQEDAEHIRSQVKEPFIQKYLKSLAVHVCTLPVTQIVSIALALLYVYLHPEMPRSQAWGVGLGIVAIFQVVPLSPGSLTRGLYVLYLVIRERNFKDYNIAVFLGFFKYVGYLAFPIQMTHRYPELARFMAGHWATDACHIVPVFGEHGALLEHKVFTLFYNWPLTIKRRVGIRTEKRKSLASRVWHAPLLATMAALALTGFEYWHHQKFGELPLLKESWFAFIPLALLLGKSITVWAGGLALGKRFAAAAVGGLIMALFNSLGFYALEINLLGESSFPVSLTLWSLFLFTLTSTVAAILTEIFLPE
jgi:hypothetical protein